MYIAVQADTLTNVAKPEGGRAPFNQFDHHREFPDAANNKIVGMNVDTLYSLANLDLTAEPIVLVVPPMEGNRWWIMQVIDAWNDVPARARLAHARGQGRKLRARRSELQGHAPGGLEEIRVDTSLVALGGRTYTGGKADYAAVHKIQDQYKLIPLSQWKGAGTELHPARQRAREAGRGRQDARTRAGVQDVGRAVLRTAVRTAGRQSRPRGGRSRSWRGSPSSASSPAQSSRPQAFDADTRKAIDEGIAAAQQAIRDRRSPRWARWSTAGRSPATSAATERSTRIGPHGRFSAWAATSSRMRIYPLTLVDSDGKKLDGANKYVLHFAKEQIPPVDAFWSLTMYDKDSYLVDNPINRYALGDRSNMKLGDDGSLTIYIQSESPGKDKEANWLPSPKAGLQAGPAAVRPEKAGRRRHLETAGNRTCEVIAILVIGVVRAAT